MSNEHDMKHVERFEDERFVYELIVVPTRNDHPHLFTYSQGPGYYCRWSISGKDLPVGNVIPVTDDQCEIIVFDSVESAVEGAREFLNL